VLRNYRMLEQVARGRARSTVATLFRWSLEDAKLLEP
jgi:hypothetical protein